jgi:hypothetical protein
MAEELNLLSSTAPQVEADDGLRRAQSDVRKALDGLQSLEFRFDWGGARIAFAQ